MKRKLRIRHEKALSEKISPPAVGRAADLPCAVRPRQPDRAAAGRNTEKSAARTKLPRPAAERVCLVDSNDDALRWRLRLIRSAQSEIILSTFDLRADNSGTDVIAALLDAAERGVQVRLIVDGINAQLHLCGNASFQALAAHENAAVRLYNPLRLTRLWTANYRCHNKYLIVG